MIKSKDPIWHLKLYIAGNTPKSVIARSNIERYCKTHLEKHYELEIIDLKKEPHLAEAHQILAIPTLVRILPKPEKKIIGDLTNEDKVLTGLEINSIKKRL